MSCPFYWDWCSDFCQDTPSISQVSDNVISCVSDSPKLPLSLSLIVPFHLAFFLAVIKIQLLVQISIPVPDQKLPWCKKPFHYYYYYPQNLTVCFIMIKCLISLLKKCKHILIILNNITNKYYKKHWCSFIKHISLHKIWFAMYRLFFFFFQKSLTHIKVGIIITGKLFFPLTLKFIYAFLNFTYIHVKRDKYKVQHWVTEIFNLMACCIELVWPAAGDRK